MSTLQMKSRPTTSQPIKLDGVTCEVVTISTGNAEAMLEKNADNRKPNRRLIDKYARDMQRGEWRFTGDAIRFDTNGSLVDGQHRLMACVKSGTAFRTLVMYGIDPSFKDVVDTGKARTTNDIVQFSGFSNARRQTTIARFLMLYRDDAWINHNQYSAQETLAILKRHPGIATSAGVLPTIPKASPGGAIAAMHYIASGLLNDPDNAAALYSVWHNGVPTYDGDPMQMLREKCLAVSGTGKKVNQPMVANTLIYCWNMFRTKQPASRVMWQNKSIKIGGLDSGLI